jgi:transcriptional regulator with XRE-family HTH domain
MDLSAIGTRVRELREAKDWSQQTLSDESGLHLNTIKNIESGKREDVGLASLNDIAAALGVTLEYLVGGKRRSVS